MSDQHSAGEQTDPGSSDPGRALKRARRRRWLSVRAQLVVAALLALVAFLAVLQVKTLNEEGDFANTRREDLVTLLATLEQSNRRVGEQIQTLQDRRDALRSASESRTTAVEQAKEQIETLSILAGTVPATGPGIVVTVSDPYEELTTTTMLNALQEMRNAGAEAIEINNTARVVADTPIEDTGNGLQVGDAKLQAPYVIDVIGPPEDLRTAMTFPGGLQDEVQQLRGTVLIRQSDDIRVTSLQPLRAPEYARPAD